MARELHLRSTMQKEITDKDGTTWTCVQAYTGLGDSEEKNAAAQVKGQGEEQGKGDDEKVYVVCTPSGGAQSVRLQLPAGWSVELSDDELLRLVETNRS